jgi:hypothetical protein
MAVDEWQGVAVLSHAFGVKKGPTRLPESARRGAL